MESKKDYVERIYNEARMKGLCRTQAEFAELLGMHQSTISNAMKGKDRYLTDSIMRRFESWERQVLHRDGDTGPGNGATQQAQREDIVIPAATMDLYTSMAKSIDRLTALVERLQPGASAFSGVMPIQKNYRIEK